MSRERLADRSSLAVVTPTCCRCFDTRPAVSTKLLTVGSYGPLELPLCQPHADLFERDMVGWTRCGTPLGSTENPVVDRARRGTVVVSHIATPVIPGSDPEPALEVTLSGGDTNLTVVGAPDGLFDWTLTAHATERRESRGVSPIEARWAAADPDAVWPGLVNDGTEVRVKGHVKVVVNPEQRRIITVINRNIAC